MRPRSRPAQLSLISPSCAAPPISGAIVSGIGVMLSSAVDRLEVERRRGAAFRRPPLAAVAVPATARRVEGARLAALRRVVVAACLTVVAARRVRVAARLVVLDARRRVDVARELVPRATWRACLVKPSMRFKTLFTSARVLAFLAWAWS